jgi:hypothetical protein
MRSYEYIAALNHWSCPSPHAVTRPDFLVSVLLVKHFGIMAAAFGKSMLCLYKTNTYKAILERLINEVTVTSFTVNS